MPFNKNQFRKLVDLETLVVLLSFAAFFVFLYFSNLFDWDHFLTSFEVDRRSWLNDFRPPVWSYQFCAGVSRIGDPQAFGLSPLFIFPLILGSYWGAKFLILFCAIVGFYFSRKILLLLASSLGQDSRLVTISASSVALLFIFGNYFAWHMHHGHMTFALYFLSIGVFFFMLKSCFSNLSKGDFWISNIMMWSIFSSGFYHVLIYFLIPFFLTAFLFFAVNRSKFFLKPKIFLALTVPGLFIASYKWIPALLYQIENPRTLDPSQVVESIDPFKSLIHHFVPTLNYAYIGGYLSHEIEGGISYGIWEYSSFSVLSWLLFALLVARIVNKKPRTLPDELQIKLRNYKIFLGVYFLVSLLFTLGNFAPFLPYPLINYFLKGSVRVVGRYEVGISAVIALLVWYLLIANTFQDYRKIMGVLPGLCILNFFSFGSFQTLNVAEVTNNESQMKTIKLVKPPDRHNSYMYFSVLQGLAVANCYNPLQRTRHFSSNYSLEDMAREPNFPFVQSAPESDCAKNSYFTQGEVFLDPSCPKDVRLNFNALREKIPVEIRNE